MKHFYLFFLFNMYLIINVQDCKSTHTAWLYTTYSYNISYRCCKLWQLIFYLKVTWIMYEVGSDLMHLINFIRALLHLKHTSFTNYLPWRTKGKVRLIAFELLPYAAMSRVRLAIPPLPLMLEFTTLFKY